MATTKQTPKPNAEEVGTSIKTGKVRFSYCHVFEPSAMKDVPNAPSKYSVNLIIRKDDKITLERIKAAIIAAAEAGKSSKFGGKIPLNYKQPLRDGDIERADDPNYAGCFFLNASSNTKPGIVDKDRQPILDTTEFYSGCYGRASINFYAFNTAGNKGVAAGLNNLQKLEDGEALAGRVSAEEDFADDDDML